jgi:hypothetical protein
LKIMECMIDSWMECLLKSVIDQVLHLKCNEVLNKMYLMCNFSGKSLVVGWSRYILNFSKTEPHSLKLEVRSSF